MSLQLRAVLSTSIWGGLRAFRVASLFRADMHTYGQVTAACLQGSAGMFLTMKGYRLNLLAGTEALPNDSLPPTV